MWVFFQSEFWIIIVTQRGEDMREVNFCPYKNSNKKNEGDIITPYLLSFIFRLSHIVSQPY